MNPKLSAMGIILASAGSNCEFRGGQTAMFASIVDPYTVEQIEAAAAEHVAKYSGWPMSDESLRAFKQMLKKQASAVSGGKPARVIERTWSERGDWTGDWSTVSLASLTWHYAMIARSPFRCNADRISEFKALCLSRRIPESVLNEAVAKARKGDHELTEFMRRIKAKAAA